MVGWNDFDSLKFVIVTNGYDTWVDLIYGLNKIKMNGLDVTILDLQIWLRFLIPYGRDGIGSWIFFEIFEIVTNG